MSKLIVTIDGPAASGKSTVARTLAQRIEAHFLDTGAMYRAVTYAALQAGLDLADSQDVLQEVERHSFTFEATDDGMTVTLDGVVIDQAIRDPNVTAQIRHIANAPAIRSVLVDWQRRFARDHERIVTEGRDQGTVAFPQAQVKIFLTADPRERAQRRHAELLKQGKEGSLESILQAVIARDHSDQTREVGALRPAEDAVHVDTTGLTIEQVVDRIETVVKERAQ